MAELALGEAQRQRMDAIAERFVTLRAEAIQGQREAYAALGEALLRGKASEVTDRSAALKEALAAAPAAQVDMMVEVVSELSEEQKRQLVERYPKMLSRQWVRSGRGPGR